MLPTGPCVGAFGLQPGALFQKVPEASGDRAGLASRCRSHGAILRS